MQEQQRIDYLQAMGIQVWMPRKVLENAAQPLWLPEQVEAENEQLSAPAAPAQFNSLSDMVSGQDLSKDSSKESSAKQQATTQNPAKLENTAANVSSGQTAAGQLANLQNTAAASDSKTSVAGQAQTSTPALSEQTTESAGAAEVSQPHIVPRFNLEFSYWTPGILWISSQPQSKQVLALQQRIAFALQQQNEQLNQLTFKWPFLDNIKEDQSEVVAKRALTAQWNFIKQQPLLCTVALDDEAMSWLEKIEAKIHLQTSFEELFTVDGKMKLWKIISPHSNILPSSTAASE